MKYRFEELSQVDAEEIANNWKYPGEYSFYDMTRYIDGYNEFVSQTMRNKENVKFHSVYISNELFGFLELNFDKNKCTIGLGIRPDLTGKKKGQSFLESIIEFIELTYPKITILTLGVAKFNMRAYKVYERVGFKLIGEYENDYHDVFYQMIREI